MALLRKRKKKTDEETTQVAPEADAAAERSPYASTEGTDGGLGEEPNTATPGSNAGSEQALADLAGLDAPDDESGGDSESEAAP